jgi:hypothetical protein
MYFVHCSVQQARILRELEKERFRAVCKNSGSFESRVQRDSIVRWLFCTFNPIYVEDIRSKNIFGYGQKSTK